VQPGKPSGDVGTWIALCREEDRDVRAPESRGVLREERGKK